MDLRSFIHRVEEARAAFDDALARVPKERMLEPGLTGPWSAKDVIAHVRWFENQMVVLIRAHALEGSDLWQLPAHERNDVIFRENRDFTLEEVGAQAVCTVADLMAALTTLDEEDLEDPTRFPGMPPDWRPADILAQNTYEHYDAHRQGLLAWLAAPPPASPEG